MNNTWHVLGAGAIGALFAFRLQRLGESVTLLTRGKNQGVQQGERRIEFINGNHRSVACFKEQTTSTVEPIHRLMVTTKSFDAYRAVTSISHRLTPQSEVILLANGMGYHHDIAKAIAPAKVIAATTTAGCHRPAADVRIISGEGETRMGWLEGSAPAPGWFRIFESAPWPCQWEPEMEIALLRKVAINAAINPATAVLDIKNGELLDGRYIDVFNKAIAETAAVLTWAGFNQLANDLPALAHTVARDTAGNTSSMRADHRAGRPTEVDHILGYLLERLRPTEDTDESRPATPQLSTWLNVLRQRARARE